MADRGFKEEVADLEPYSAVLEELLRLKSITGSTVISQWDSELEIIFNDIMVKAYMNGKFAFEEANDPFVLRFMESGKKLLAGLQSYVEEGFDKWSQEKVDEYRHQLRTRSQVTIGKTLLVTNAFAALEELQRLQKILTQSDIKPIVEELIGLMKQTVKLRFDDNYDFNDISLVRTGIKEHYEKTYGPAATQVKLHLQMYINQTVFLNPGDIKLKWQVVGYHKDWVHGITIIESQANACAHGPEKAIPLVRFQTKATGCLQYLIYEGAYYPGVAQEVIRRAGDIVSRLAVDDGSAIVEYNKAFKEAAFNL